MRVTRRVREGWRLLLLASLSTSCDVDKEVHEAPRTRFEECTVCEAPRPTWTCNTASDPGLKCSLEYDVKTGRPVSCAWGFPRACPEASAAETWAGMCDSFVATPSTKNPSELHCTFSPTQPYDEAVSKSVAADVALPPGYCGKTEPLTLPAQVDGLVPVGEIRLSVAGTPLATVSKYSSGVIYGFELPFTIPSTVDMTFSGSPFVPAATLPGAIRIPTEPVFASPKFDGTDAIAAGDTFTFTAPGVDDLLLFFRWTIPSPSFLVCRLDPKSGTFTLKPLYHAELGPSGDMWARARTHTTPSVAFADGKIRRIAIGTQLGPKLVAFTKK